MTERDNCFPYKHSELYCEEVPLRRIAEKFGTPCYVYSSRSIVGHCRLFRETFQNLKHQIFYSVKANSNLRILRLIQDEGCGFDVVSGGELYRLEKIGADLSKVVFSGVGKTREEIGKAIDSSILSINVESLQELEAIIQIAREKNSGCRISLRINPDVNVKTHPYIATGLREHKFGLDTCLTEEVFSRLDTQSRVRLVGIASHIGSQILDVDPFMEAFLRIRETADLCRAKGHPVEHLDLGGGFGIPYQNESLPDLARYASFLLERADDYTISFEPGRYIVGAAGVLLCQVLYTKSNLGKRFIVVDGAMNDFLRPTLYQAHHEVLSVQHRTETTLADMVGPVCESGDYFARGRELPRVNKGEMLALLNAGAYGFVAASNYNSRPRPAEVLVYGDHFELIRRRETLEDLIRAENW